jgi:hypothetical protein
MGGEAILVAVALLLTLGLLDVGPEPVRAEMPVAPPDVAPTTLTAESVERPPVRRPTVMVIGDSLVVQSAQAQRDALAARGYDVIVAGQSGRALDHPWIQGQVSRAADDPTVDIVVLATAANDNFGNAARASERGDDPVLRAYGSLLDRTLSRLGDRCIVLVDARDRTDRWFAPDYAPKTNTVLAAAAASRPDTRLVTWSDSSRPHGLDWFEEDLLHFRPGTDTRPSSGSIAYADAIADQVDRCPADR